MLDGEIDAIECTDRDAVAGVGADAPGRVATRMMPGTTSSVCQLGKSP